MPRQTQKSPARVLAPLALALATVAFLFVLFSSGSGDRNEAGDRATDRNPRTERAGRSERRRPRRATYTVKTGDTLAGIAEKVNLSVEKLQELNPELDPQALVSGQKIKLRE
jgi:hypothetical protein